VTSASATSAYVASAYVASAFSVASASAANASVADTMRPMLPPTVYSCPRSSMSDLGEKLRKERMLGHVSKIQHKK
jgi:hypothetical protein